MVVLFVTPPPNGKNSKVHNRRMSFFSVTYSVSGIRTFKLQTCKEANIDLHVQSCRLVHTSGVHCHILCILYKWLCLYCTILYSAL